MTSVGLVVALLGVACAGSSASDLAEETAAVATTAPAATTAPEPPPTEARPTEPPPTEAPTAKVEPAINPPVFDEPLLRSVVDEIDVEDGTFLFTVIDEEGEVTAASNGTDSSGVAPTGNAIYQIGSFTKVFTALATLTLVDDGIVDLDAPADEYVNRIPVPAEVTVRDLLQHTSGIYNLTDSPQFLATAFDDPSRRWTPEELIEFVGERPPVVAPGFSFNYSNTNYLILGVLVEEVTGQLYHEVVRERIIDPLGMSSTYLAGFEEGPASFDPYKHDGVADYDLSSIATASWSSGAMVSSAPDLHLLFGALFNTEIISEGLVAQMTQGAEMRLGVSHYGLGLDLGQARNGFYGHPGGNPGYMVLIHHAPQPGVTTFLAATDSRWFAPPSFGSAAQAERAAAMNKALTELTSS